ncbi:MAG: serine/threonine-protein kinase [Dermatophilaceae bacterium]
MPGFTITGELSSDATGSTWAAVRTLGDQPLALKILPVSDVTAAQSQAAVLMALLDRIDNEHLVRQHGAIALPDGTLALVLDQVTGGSLAQLLGDRGHLTPGETVTTVAPLFGALADLHAAGVLHGDLTPGSVLFSADGRPLISDLGVARLLGRPAGQADRAECLVAPEVECLVAPEVVSGAAPSSASDVYSMAALGWLCLTGAPPGPASARPPLSTVSPRIPARLADVLSSCLSVDPTARPSARAAAIEVFDAAPAESVILRSVADPATEITRRIRATAGSASVPAPPLTSRRFRRPLVLGAVALLVAAVIGGASTWFLARTPEAAQPAAVRSTAAAPTAASTAPTAASTASGFAPTRVPQVLTDVMTAPDSPRVAAAGLLQALVDARALAYATRSPVLLDLVYAPGATKAGADRSNLATALENGATYLGLAFVVKSAAFLDGTSDTARVRATIVTPAYETGQPDGRKVGHAQETVGPSVFTLSLTRDGWRILALAVP